MRSRRLVGVGAVALLLAAAIVTAYPYLTYGSLVAVRG